MTTTSITLVSSYDGHADYEVCDRGRNITARVRVDIRARVMTRTGADPVPPEWAALYNAAKTAEHAAACDRYAADPDVLAYLATIRPTPVVPA
jgi:hypothetical protein